MFEELLEDIAQKNGLREVNTYLKLAAGLGAILLCLLSTSYIPPLFIAIVLTGAILFLARVDAKTYAELFIVPLWFAIMSVAGIILIYRGTGYFLAMGYPAIVLAIHHPGKYKPGRVCLLPGYWRDVCDDFYCPDNSDDRYFYCVSPVQGSGSSD